MLPAWCVPVAYPDTPVPGSSGSGNVVISSPYFASIAGDTSGIAPEDVLWTGEWNGGPKQPSVSGGSFSYPFACEVSMWSGKPDNGTLTLTCSVLGVALPLQLYITFDSAAGAAAWGTVESAKPLFWTDFVNTFEVR